jgi:hypothetical protein
VHGYNYDAFLNEPALFDRVVPRAFASDDYIEAHAEAKARIVAGDKDQPKLKTPDRIGAGPSGVDFMGQRDRFYRPKNVRHVRLNVQRAYITSGCRTRG